ncbi:hypothetical protein NTE_00082 [Candidatus Nitrososphaera evergladensis SR1]|jgi:hypothetical protein|uniref:HTH marR-type domain-containing protein n=1 Tax=Candidatus Nitrososphaera evergladensis SR1 TaxID=1459636 RepID=A0A075ML62_9ARCH|nr:helix-turn-helix domain-containing protein [Candidatus Nitrososphaera evergladensis]AIF82166.1 hypothetical protein NTE_00082 [Candidatus Nitrososphaera evergladensis SR1]
MILDLPLNITIDLGIVILGVLFYAGGLVTVMALRRFREAAKRDDNSYHADDAVVEAVVLEYTRRLKDYDRVIAEMRTKLDIVEVKTQALVQQPHVMVQQQPSSPMSQQQAPHAQSVSEPVTVTQHPPAVTTTVAVEVEDGSGGQSNNGTIDYILKLLVERPRTSREVQHAIGRTREHTARLMKKLHESGLVSRDVNSKPFRYNITEAGRTRLTKERPSAAQAPKIQQA